MYSLHKGVPQSHQSVILVHTLAVKMRFAVTALWHRKLVG